MKMILSIVAGVSVGLLASSPAAATTKEQIVGTWRLISFTRQNDAGKVTNALGDRPAGYMILTAEGRISVFFVDTSRKSPAGAAPTDAEAAQLWRTIVGYIGSYKVDPVETKDGLKITVRSERSWSPAQEGVDRDFFEKLDGSKLTSTSVPTRNTVTGEVTTNVLVFEKE
jgi:hypothetical protein